MSNADFNPYAAPLSDLVPELVDEGANLWRDGALLIVRKESTFPDNCVKCNAPAEGWRLKRTLYWHHPAIYLLLVFAPLFCILGLVYVIVAFAMRNKMKIEFGLCPRHRRSRRWAIALTLAMATLGFERWTIIGVSMSFDRRPSFPAMPWIGVGLMVLAIIFGFVAVPSLRAKRIDQLYARLRGACAEFLAPLPQWDEGLSGPNWPPRR